MSPLVPQPAPEPDSTAHAVVAWIFAVLTLCYMLPWAIAATRHTKNAPAIGVLNFFLGWSGVGWLGMLIWACVDEHKNARPFLPYAQPMMVVTPPPGYQQINPQVSQQYVQPNQPQWQHVPRQLPLGRG